MAEIPRIARRRFLHSFGAGAVSAGAFAARWSAPWRSATAAVRYDGLKSRDYLGDVQIETRIVDAKVFTEGPAVDRAGTLFFTNTEVSKILAWDAKAKKLSTFRENTGGANGLAFDRHGRLCQWARKTSR